MKILFFSDAGSIHTRRWVEHFRDAGHDIHLISFRYHHIEGIHLYLLSNLGLGKIGYFMAFFSLKYLFNKISPDIVHAQYITSYGFLSAIAGMRPLVLTAWGTDVLISPNKSRLKRWLASYAVKHADAVTTVAQHMIPSVATLGIPESSVIAVPFGVDTTRFVPPKAVRLEGTPLRLICTRNFARIYDLSTLITALKFVTQKGLDLQVDLVGAGPLRSELEAQVMRLGLSSRVTFHGHVNHDRLAQLLALSDLFVSPALSDGNNVSLNEAMACATFPIATSIPANIQWIEDSVNGLLYPPGDAVALADCILRAANDTALRIRAGRLNRDIVEQRADWRGCVAKMTDIYCKVAGQKAAYR